MVNVKNQEKSFDFLATNYINFVYNKRSQLIFADNLLFQLNISSYFTTVFIRIMLKIGEDDQASRKFSHDDLLKTFLQLQPLDENKFRQALL
jgi:hypothetical protein